MIEIKNDRWGKTLEVNGTPAVHLNYSGMPSSGTFKFFIDVDSGDIYSEDTERILSVNELTEVLRYIRKNMTVRSKEMKAKLRGRY